MRHKICGIDGKKAEASVYWYGAFAAGAAQGVYRGGPVSYTHLDVYKRQIQAAVFGWVPVLLWVLIGGIFFGAVHDFGALFASIRHKGQSIGEVIADSMGTKAKKIFIIFSYLTLLLVVAAFASIVANTFMATYTAVSYTHLVRGASGDCDCNRRNCSDCEQKQHSR